MRVADVHHFRPPDECSAVLDGTGRICSVSRSWKELANCFADPSANCGIGRNYLEYCIAPEAQLIRLMLQELLDGRRPHFAAIYDCGESNTVDPVALIGTSFQQNNRMMFLLRHISLGRYSVRNNGLSAGVAVRELKEIMPISDSGMGDFGKLYSPTTVRALAPLFIALDSIKAALDDGILDFGRDDYRGQVEALLAETAGIIDRIFDAKHL